MADKQEDTIEAGFDFASMAVLAVWFVPFEGGDWLCNVWRDEENAFCIRYRTRYYTGGTDPFADDDKRWADARDTTSGWDDATAIAAMMKVAQDIAGRAGSSVDFIDMRVCRDADERWALLLARPWAHQGATIPAHGGGPRTRDPRSCN